MDMEFNKNACAQGYVIINYLMQTGEIVVSEKLMNYLEINRNKDYNYSINDLNTIKLLPDTEKILTEVYLESIATAEERETITELVSRLKEIIKNEPIEEVQTSLAPMSMTELKWSEKFKIAIKRLLYIVNPARRTYSKEERNRQQNY